MWYAVQTVSGEEERVSSLMESLGMEGAVKNFVIPSFEQVYRSSNSYRIYMRGLFPGYILVESDDPHGLFRTLKRIPEFTRFLGAEREEGESVFLPLSSDDMRFIFTLLDDGVLHLSYIRMKRSRIDTVVGPLSSYMDHIKTLDIRHRRAIVEKKIFGKHHRIYFGLRTDDDPRHAWLAVQMEETEKGAVAQLPVRNYDIGIHPGDLIRSTDGIYGEYEMTVLSVDHVRRILTVQIRLFGRLVRVQLFADDVEVI